MTATAELELRARVVGESRTQLRALRGELRAMDQQQERALRAGRRGVDLLARSWERAGRGVQATSRQIGVMRSELFSIKSLALGIAGGAAGRTLFDSLIGSNMEMEQRKVTFQTMIGDAQKAAGLMRDIEQYAASTPLRQDDLLESSKRLLRLTKDNVEWNARLVKEAGRMASINPTKTATDAAEALLDAEQGEFERLKEFGIKFTKTDVEKMRKRGESFGAAAMRGITDALNKQTGGRDVVGALSQTLSGKISTFRDRFTIFMRNAGEPAFEELKSGMDDVMTSFTQLEQNPQFREDVRELGSLLAEGAKHAVTLATKIPQGVSEMRALYREASAFYGEHESLILGAGGLLLANKVSGGLVARGGGAAVGAGIKGAGRLLFGKGGGALAGGAGALSAGAAGAVPVYVVNGGDLGSGLGSVLKGGGGAAAASYGNGLFGSLASKGVVGTLAGGGLAASSLLAGGAIVGLIGGGAATFTHVVKETSDVLEGFNRQIDRTEREEREREQRLRRQTYVDERDRTSDDRRQFLIREAAGYAGMGQFDRARGILSELSTRARTRGEIKRLEEMMDAGFSNMGVDVSVGAGGTLGFQARMSAQERKSYQSAQDLLRRARSPQAGDAEGALLHQNPHLVEALERKIGNLEQRAHRAQRSAKGLSTGKSLVDGDAMGHLQGLDANVKAEEYFDKKVIGFINAMGQMSLPRINEGLNQGARKLNESMIENLTFNITVNGNADSATVNALKGQLMGIMPEVMMQMANQGRKSE